jgi:type II secretory ATPase GspE/PulE/Tfp pilus assembly ATPase PilB-like protein
MGFFKKKKSDVVEPEIDLNALGGTGPENQRREIEARQIEQIVPTKELLYDALVKRADKIMLDFTRDAVAGQYMIDGHWHSIEVRDRATGDGMLAVLKTLGGLKVEERRARQEGKFQVEHQLTKAKFVGTLTSQGVKTGERAIIDLVAKKRKDFKTLDELGMREQMQQRLLEHLRAPQGLVLIAGPPGNGFTTTWNVSLRSTDRMLRDFLGVEDKGKHETDVENVNIHTFDGAAGVTPDTLLPKLMLTQPEVIVFSDLCNGATVNKLCEYANDPREGKLVIAGVRAQDACEALLRVLLLKATAKEFAKAVRAVLCVRLVRKLNDTCKQPYTPPPQLLAKLGIPAGRVKVLYKEWTPPPPPTPEEEKEIRKRKAKLPPTACPLCEQEGSLCHGIGYRGRSGIFELLDVNDQIRDALVKEPKLDVLRKLARANGHLSLQEEGILLVAQGLTSLTELQRVLK